MNIHLEDRSTAICHRDHDYSYFKAQLVTMLQPILSTCSEKVELERGFRLLILLITGYKSFTAISPLILQHKLHLAVVFI